MKIFMGAGHSHTGEKPALTKRGRLTITLVLAAGYMIAEVLGGLYTGSLALLADAGHMLSDVAALALTLFALWVAQKPAHGRMTYGFYRTEILAALVNGATLIGITIYIFSEAYGRLREPQAVQGAPMMLIATGGLIVNLVGLWILNSEKDNSLNVKGAWLHVLTDALGSVGAMIAGLVIWFTGLTWVDPLVSAGIGLLIIYSSWNLLRETVSVLMESAPTNIDVDAVRAAMLTVPGARAVHDLHIWVISSGLVSLSAHVSMAGAVTPDWILSQLRSLLKDEFGISHFTLQLKTENYDGRSETSHL